MLVGAGLLDVLQGEVRSGGVLTEVGMLGLAPKA